MKEEHANTVTNKKQYTYPSLGTKESVVDLTKQGKKCHPRHDHFMMLFELIAFGRQPIVSFVTNSDLISMSEAEGQSSVKQHKFKLAHGCQFTASTIVTQYTRQLQNVMP